VDDDQYAERCGSCGAFGGVVDDPELGRVGRCSLEVFPPPLRATATCVRYRPKGALGATPRPRAAGEPRRGSAAARPSSPSSLRRQPDAPAALRRPLPKEIDIDMDIDEFRSVLREVIADELGAGEVELGRRWQGGELVLKPGDAETQDKSVPIETFFHKIVMIRDKLRVLEAKVNAHKGMAVDEKIQLQSYITACYGTLTTFNVLFANREDGFTTKG